MKPDTVRSEPVLISVRHLCKHYGRNIALDNISFDILQGRITGFLGPNGAGKTTAINCLLGLLKTDKESRILINQHEEFRDFKELKFKVKIGALLEKYEFYGYMTPTEYLELLSFCDHSTINQKEINRLFNLVNLGNSKDIKIKKFSYGMRQKLALACALRNDPDLLILDEPFNGLDPNAMDNLSKLLKKYSEEGGTVFISSHILGELEELCQNIIVINNGTIIIQGTMEEITSQKSLKEIYLEATC